VTDIDVAGPEDVPHGHLVGSGVGGRHDTDEVFLGDVEEPGKGVRVGRVVNYIDIDKVCEEQSDELKVYVLEEMYVVYCL